MMTTKLFLSIDRILFPKPSITLEDYGSLYFIQVSFSFHALRAVLSSYNIIVGEDDFYRIYQEAFVSHCGS